jgi:hypothetical protein
MAEYHIGILCQSKNTAQAEEFIGLLKSTKGTTALEKYGFEPIRSPADPASATTTATASTSAA